MSDIFLPNKPRSREDPFASGLVQENLEYLISLFQKGLKDGDTLVWDQLQGRFLAKEAGGIERVTALPVSDLYDGKQITLTDSIATPNFLWHLVYNQFSPSPYKWECFGGTPLFKSQTSDHFINNTIYQNNIIGPVVSLPVGVGGDFYISVEGHIGIRSNIQAPIDVDRAFLSYAVGVVPASDTWSIHTAVGVEGPSGAAEIGATGSMTFKHLNVASGAQIAIRHRQEGGLGHSVRGTRVLQIMPQRVG